MNTFYTSQLLVYLREKNNFTIQDVADFLGVSKAAVCKWEKGDDVKIDHLYALAKLYNVSFSELCKGTLNGDSEFEYKKRDYDLSKYEFDSINSKTLSAINKFYECYSKINERFFTLLPKYLTKKINKEELIEYRQLEEYYSFDREYINWLINTKKLVLDVEEDEEIIDLDYEEALRKKMRELINLSPEEMVWELSKYYIFNKNIKIKDVLESNNLYAIHYLFSNISQQDKDYIFNDYLCYEEEYEPEPLTPFDNLGKYRRNGITIGDEKIVKVMLKDKAHCYNDILFAYNGYEVDSGLEMVVEGSPQDVFEKVTGNITLDEEKTEISIILDTRYPFFESPKFWKYFSLDEYNKIVDLKKTRKYKDIFRLKDTDPVQYYNNLVEGKYE